MRFDFPLKNFFNTADARLRPSCCAKARHSESAKKAAPEWAHTSPARRDRPVTDRGHYLHHPMHAQAIYDRCREIGVPVIADLPGLKIKPPANGPATMRDFLLQHLQSN